MISTVIDYYYMPVVIINNAEIGDEILTNGKNVYVLSKEKYERGEIVLANDYAWKDKKMYQVSRRIIGLPGEFIEQGGIGLHKDQYAVRTSVTDGELTSTFREVIPEGNIYGVIVGEPLSNFESKFDYFINRTKHLPYIIKSKGLFSINKQGMKYGRQIPTISRTISVVNRNEEGFAVEYTIGAGDSLWKVIKDELLLRDKTKTDEELIFEVDEIKDILIKMPSSELKSIGFSSGDIGILKSGDKINVLEIIGRYNIRKNKENNELIGKNKSNSNDKFFCGVDSIKDNDNNSYPTVLINDQCWMAKNLNIGIKVNNSEQQSDNKVIEKYCYDNNDDNCADFGGLYKWDEMMQYQAIEKTRGICPEGWHIPSDSEYYSLEKYFSTGTCNPNRSSDPEDCYPAGRILREGGSSKFNVIFAGSRFKDGYGTDVHYWTSSELENRAWHRNFMSYSSAILRTTIIKSNSLSVRCLRD